jgi:hypothetical protein
MRTEKYPLDDGTTGIVFFRPKLLNEKELIDRVELRGSNNEMLKKWNFSAMPRTRQQAAQELDFPV